MDYYRSLTRKLHTASTLHWGDWAILARAWVWLLYSDILLRVRPFPRVQQVVDKQYRGRSGVRPEQGWDIIRHYRRMVTLAARIHLYPMTCLRQALALKVLLGTQGIPTKLRFGVRKETDKILAHAWLEYEGEAIELSDPTEHFSLLESLEKQE